MLSAISQYMVIFFWFVFSCSVFFSSFSTSLSLWICVFIFQFLRYNKILRYLKCAMWWFDICLHCEEIQPTMLIHTFRSINSRICVCVCVCEEFLSLGMFQFCNTLLSIIVIMLFIRFSYLINFITEYFTLLPTSLYFPHSAPSNHFSVSTCSWFFKDSTHKWYHAVFVFSNLFHKE